MSATGKRFPGVSCNDTAYHSHNNHPQLITVLLGGVGAHGYRGPEHAREASHRGSHAQQTRVHTCINNLSDTQKRQKSEVCNQSEVLEQTASKAIYGAVDTLHLLRYTDESLKSVAVFPKGRNRLVLGR